MSDFSNLDLEENELIQMAAEIEDDVHLSQNKNQNNLLSQVAAGIKRDIHYL